MQEIIAGAHKALSMYSRNMQNGAALLDTFHQLLVPALTRGIASITDLPVVVLVLVTLDVALILHAKS